MNHIFAAMGPEAAEATSKIAAELDNDSSNVRLSALYALREIGRDASSAKPALLAYLKQHDKSDDQDRFERLAAAWTLARVAPRDAEVVAAVLPVLREGLESEVGRERLESINAAGDLAGGAKPLKELLRKIAKVDSHPEIREAAKSAASDDQ